MAPDLGMGQSSIDRAVKRVHCPANLRDARGFRVVDLFGERVARIVEALVHQDHGDDRRATRRASLT
jgi:hypothetical protein